MANCLFSKDEFLDFIEGLNDTSLKSALREISTDEDDEDYAEDVCQLQADFFFDDFSEWFNGLGKYQCHMIDLLVNEQECRDRLKEFTVGFDLSDLFSDFIDSTEAELFQ